MEPTGLVGAFRRLPTTDSRQRALEALVKELTPYEWRRLQSITSARSFQFDIVGQLPVELVAHIFSYLDTTTPYRLQLVSRRWRHALQSLDVLKRSLNCWYDGTVDLQGADHAFCERKAQSIHAFRTGNPRSRFKLLTLCPLDDPILIGDTLIWTPRLELELPRHVYALNLSTWVLSVVRGEARESVLSLCASDQLMVFTTNTNVCYVSQLNGQGRKKFKVPSSQYFHAITCRERTVACAGCFDDHISVYIWDYDTQQGRSFEIHHPSPLVTTSYQECIHEHRLALLLQPESRSIIIVGDNPCFRHNRQIPDIPPEVPRTCEKPQPHMLYSRFSYSGECIHDAHTIFKDLTGTYLQVSNLHFFPVSSSGVFAIPVRAETLPKDIPICVQLDEHRGSFTDPMYPSSEGSPWLPRSVACWKDTFYQALHKDTSSTTTQILAFVGTSDRPDLKPLAPVPSDLIVGDDVNWASGSRVLLNDRYVIRTAAFGFYLLCFEESNGRPKESGPFFDIGRVEVVDGVDV